MDFGGSKDMNMIVNELVKRVNDNTRRVRVLEERLRNIDMRANDTEKALIEGTKQFNDDVHRMENEIKETRDRLANAELDITNFKREFKKLVTVRDLRKIEEYIELLNPIMEKYTTKKEVEKMIEAKVR